MKNHAFINEYFDFFQTENYLFSEEQLMSEEKTPKYNFLLKYPSRNRPHLFKETLCKYRDMLSGEHNYQFLISLDTDDRTMNNPEIRYWLERQKNMMFCYDHNKSKVQAINADMDHADPWDILILVSDDMIPCAQNYDKIIADDMFSTFCDMSGCLHYNDGRAGAGLNTLSIMGNALYQRFGYIYHPDYRSLWCDNEYHDVTKMWGKTKYIDQVIIKHSWTEVTGQDALHTRNETFYSADSETYRIRKERGFPTESVGRSGISPAATAPSGPIRDRRRPVSRFR